MSKHNPKFAVKENHINQREGWAEITNVFGERLLQLRKAHKLTQRALAALLGVSQTAINKYEKSCGKRKLADGEQINRIAATVFSVAAIINIMQGLERTSFYFSCLSSAFVLLAILCKPQKLVCLFAKGTWAWASR